MARITPKTNWLAPDVPVKDDFNRIEGNTAQAFSEIDQEVIDRAADVDAEEARAIADVDAEEARAIADVDAEEARASAAEGVLQGNINTEAATRASNDAAITTALKTIGGVGSYAFLGTTTTGIILSAGQIYNNAGGELHYACWSNRSPAIIISGAPSGSWMCMGYFDTTADSTQAVSLFIRVS